MTMNLTTPLACLVGFAVWALALVAAVASARGLLVVTGKAKPNAFPSGTQHGGDMYWRLNRAHMNTNENLPIFASLVLAGTLSGVQTPIFATLSVVTLGARIAQSLIHVASGSAMAVNLRFTAFCVQLGCWAVMALEIFKRL
jgi:uncharacterized MAPEG superfamily protein